MCVPNKKSKPLFQGQAKFVSSIFEVFLTASNERRDVANELIELEAVLKLDVDEEILPDVFTAVFIVVFN